MAERDVSAVLAQYPVDHLPIGPLETLGAAGGFSGALFWRFPSSRGPLLLRRWPREHPTVERLTFIQAVLRHVWQHGFRRLPLPLETIRGGGFVQEGGQLWELVAWMPGTADYHLKPSPARLDAALRTLGQFHQAAFRFPLPDVGPHPSPGICQRTERLKQLQAGGFAVLRDSIAKHNWLEFTARARQVLDLACRAAPYVMNLLQSVAGHRVSIAPCIRDIWHDHVLYSGDEVSALIDFGAMRPENVAADVSRLLGSMVGDDPDGWSRGLAAYQEVRPLVAKEHQLLVAFDASTVLLSGLNWIQWLCVEGRQFEAQAPILSRMDDLITRLARLASFRRED